MQRGLGRETQGGAVLVVVLILLLVMTLLGLASLRGTIMEERMSAGMVDRSLNFQAVEAALRIGEEVAANTPTIPIAGCSLGVCATPDDSHSDRWKDTGFEGWVAVDAGLGDLVENPEYFIEYMGKAPSWPRCDSEMPVSSLCLKSRYRITARSRSDEPGRAYVVLQSTYAGG